MSQTTGTMMAYAIQTDAGIRLFDTAAEAEVYEGPDGYGYCTPLAVPKAKHYRGPCGPRGVLFMDVDQSFGVLLGAINHRGDADRV